MPFNRHLVSPLRFHHQRSSSEEILQAAHPHTQETPQLSAPLTLGSLDRVPTLWMQSDVLALNDGHSLNDGVLLFMRPQWLGRKVNMYE